jgi:predicted outer membrane repeat protein
MQSRAQLCFILATALLLGGERFSIGATFTVANGDVVGLNNAILASNSNGQDDTINLAIFGTYTLTTQQFVTTGFDGLARIEGDGGHTLTINGGFSSIQRSTAGGTPNFRIFDIGVGANVTFILCGIKYGVAAPVGGSGEQYDEGGGIYNRGAVTLVNVSVNFNSARVGGGVYNLPGSSLVAQNCEFTSNLVSTNVFSDDRKGGAIFHGGNSLTVTNSTFTTNVATIGGAIALYSATGPTVTVTDTTFSANSASSGGAIYSDALSSLTLTRDTFVGVTNDYSAGYGGAITLEGTACTLTSCSFSNMWCFVLGGAIYNFHGSVTGSMCTFAGGLASAGGAIGNSGGSTTLSNCTFSANSANQGGALKTESDASGQIVNLSVNTFGGNSAGLAGGIYCYNNYGQSSSTVLLANNIFKTGANGRNFEQSGSSASITSQGNNLSNDPANGDGTTGPGGFLNASGDIRNTDPQLAALADNGGQTQTIALLANSPAINAGNNANAPPRDQRSYARSGLSDIGAFEYQGSLTPLTAVSRKTHGTTAFDLNLPLTGTVGVECRRNTGADGSGPNAGHDHQVIVSFPYPVAIDSASGDHSVTADALPTGFNQVYTLNLHNVPNATLVTLSLNNVRDNTNAFTDTIPMGVLLGDVNGDSFVLSGDYTAVRQKSGATVDATTCQYDINADGFILSGDYTTVRQQSGSHLSPNPKSSNKLRLRNWFP